MLTGSHNTCFPNKCFLLQVLLASDTSDTFNVWQAYMDIRINNQAAKAQYQYKYVPVYSRREIDRTVNSIFDARSTASRVE
jgi:hypothetical protein